MDLIKSGRYIDIFLCQNMRNNKNKHNGGVSCSASMQHFYCITFSAILLLILYFKKNVLLNIEFSDKSHPVGLDVWFLVRPFICFHTLCVRTVKALVRLRRWEPLLVAYVISTIISWFIIYFNMTKRDSQRIYIVMLHLYSTKYDLFVRTNLIKLLKTEKALASN